ncbi:hypothetical protein DCC85_14435 [Paenibacillus sp. CAA11]|nr:hypothetical protein DCC85_14435 [Paenibacillus sp. CAA11]
MGDTSNGFNKLTNSLDQLQKSRQRKRNPKTTHPTQTLKVPPEGVSGSLLPILSYTEMKINGGGRNVERNHMGGNPRRFRAVYRSTCQIAEKVNGGAHMNRKLFAAGRRYNGRLYVKQLDGSWTGITEIIKERPS